jgi:hypothetical protein
VKKTKVIRQGDVILREISNLPYWARYEDSKKEIRITGETGHAHVLKGEVYGDGGVGSYVRLTEPGELEHEEHDHIVVPPGIYMVDSVRDYRAQVERRGRYYD